MDRELQAHFGTRLNADFSDVRIHTDGRAAHSAETLQAQAFTVGKDIVFGSNRFEPNSSAGQHLLAHELSHVAQPEASGSRPLSQAGDASEREADHIADTVLQGGSATPQIASSAAIQREPLKDTQQPRTESVLDRMLDQATPFLAASIGSATLSGFDTGKSDLKPEHLTELRNTAQKIQSLMTQYPHSTVSVIGHTDTVGTEANNLTLGEARAATAAAALEKFGVPAGIVTTTSVGEGPTQAVKTKDETPQAKNRRVEVRFEPSAGPVAPPPQGKLEPPSSSVEFSPPTPPPVDLTYHPTHDDDHKGPPYRHDDDPYSFSKPWPAGPKPTGPHSLIDVIGERVIDPVIDKVAHGLSKGTRAKIKEAARDAITAGVAKSARLAAEQAGVHDTASLDAIENATKAAIKEKGQAPP